jgi:hypothetical protein
MSAANAAAKKRRAVIPANPIASTPNIKGGAGGYNTQVGGSSSQLNSNIANQSPVPSHTQGLTLQQVISVIDKRLVNLEKSVGDINKKHSDLPILHNLSSGLQSNIVEQSQTHISKQLELNKQTQENFQLINDNLIEYDSRFEILANELVELKNIVLNLQSYTMNVNKMLLEEKKQNTELVSNDNNLNTDNEENNLILNDIYTMSDKKETTYTLLQEYDVNKEPSINNEIIVEQDTLSESSLYVTD